MFGDRPLGFGPPGLPPVGERRIHLFAYDSAFESRQPDAPELSDNLRGERIGDLIAAGSDYAKRQPLAFFAGALVAGFAASRFLLSHKPSSSVAAPVDAGGPDLRSGQ